MNKHLISKADIEATKRYLNSLKENKDSVKPSLVDEKSIKKIVNLFTR